MSTNTVPIDADVERRLVMARDQVATEISRTDAKAVALLTVVSIPTAVLVATIPGSNFALLPAVLTGLGTLGVAAAMLIVLVVIRPRLNVKSLKVRGTWAHWAECTPEEIVEDVKAIRLPEVIAGLSRIAKKKFEALRIAIDITVVSVSALVVGLLASLI